MIALVYLLALTVLVGGGIVLILNGHPFFGGLLLLAAMGLRVHTS